MHQWTVVLDIASPYTEHADKKTWPIRNCLDTTSDLLGKPVNYKSGPQLVDVSLPHGEFVLGLSRTLDVQIREGLRHVAVGRLQGGRMVLWTGYHRSYARMEKTRPDGIEKSLLAALDDDFEELIVPSFNPSVRDALLGLRAPVLSDFFDERLFIRVRIPKKRYEVQCRVVPINDEPN